MPGRIEGFPKRIGIFGGSFDPPHVGHVLILQDVIERLSLDLAIVVPAGIQPVKGALSASADHRLAMVRDSFGGIPSVLVDPIELERPGLSFMVDTVTVYHSRWPSAQLFLVLGADAAAGLGRWRSPDRILRLAHLAVMERQGLVDGGEKPWLEWPGILSPVELDIRRVDVSSSEVRQRVASGLSIDGFVSRSVSQRIAEHGLYNMRTAC